MVEVQGVFTDRFLSHPERFEGEVEAIGILVESNGGMLVGVDDRLDSLERRDLESMARDGNLRRRVGHAEGPDQGVVRLGRRDCPVTSPELGKQYDG